MPVSKKRSSNTWTRPDDWLPLPVVTAAEDKFVGLIAVFDTGSNFLAFTATGDFTVDWGDGSGTENVASGVTAQHQYTYSSISSSTLSSRGYRQALVTITPQAGQQLLSVSVDRRHSGASAVLVSTPWLDVVCSCNPASTTGFTAGDVNSPSPLLEQATLLNGASRTSFSIAFRGCTSLQSLPLFTTSASTNFSGMFQDCKSLKTIPLIDTAAGTNFSGMFQSCTGLQEVPLINTSQATSVNSMFSTCSVLRAIPAINTSAATNFSFMFQSCFLLTTVPTLNTAAGTNFTSMFHSCVSLVSVPALNLASGTNFTNMFNTCRSLAKSLVTGVSATISYASCNLSAAALDEIYTNLATAVAQTITVTGNYGVSGDTPTIATLKGWTVTG